MTKAILTHKQIEEDPNVFWNAFLDVVGGDDDPKRSPLQQLCHLCFRYYSEVMNGGHLQFFVNNGFDYASEVFAALQGLGVVKVANILEEALRIATSHHWKDIKSVEDFVDVASEELFQQQDDAFYSLSPDLLEQLQDIGRRQKNEFFTIVPE